MGNEFSFSQQKNRTAALIGALGALTVLLTVTRLGFIPWFAGTAITVLHVPVILAVCLSGSGVFALHTALGVGCIFGLSSLVYAAVSPLGAIDPFFVNPLISVLPRLLFAATVYFLSRFFSFVFTPLHRMGVVLATALTAFIGTMAHAFFVFFSLVFAKAIPWSVVWAVIAANTFLEAAAAVILVLAVTGAVHGIAEHRTSKLNSKNGKQ